MTQTEALKLALEALEQHGCPWLRHKKPYNEAITAIKEALAQPNQDEKFCDSNCVWTDHHPDCKLAQPKQEPRATREDFYRELDRSVERVRKEMQIKSVTMRGKDYDLALPIIDAHFGHVFVGQVPTPPQRKPLTDEELYKVFPAIATYHEANKTLYRSIARAIEAAHGIKGEA